MSNHGRIITLSLGFVAAAAAPACQPDDTPAGPEGCLNDLECKGERICVNGQCINGDPAPLQEEDRIEEEDAEQLDFPDECQGGAPNYQNIADFCPLPLVVMIDTSGGNPVLSNSEVTEEIEFVNSHFANSGISFVIHDIIEFNNNDTVEDTRSPDHITLAFYDPSNQIVSGICGSAPLGPNAEPVARVKRTCTSFHERSTTVHELGHTLGLPHPHGSEDVEALEDNCYTSSAGDFLCDTPPDPGTSRCDHTIIGPGVCEVACEVPWQGYSPNPHLVMSYYNDTCQTPGSAFSQEQINSMRCIIDLFYSAMGQCGSCSPGNCNDDNSCTDDYCSNDACNHTPVEDGLACGPNATCLGGFCVGGECGDGVINADEDCDGGALGGEDCQSQGFDSGALSCTQSCIYDTSLCCNDNVGTVCSNNDVYWRDSCGQLGTLADDCAGEEFCVQLNASEAICEIPPETCGNGALDLGEACDGGLFGPQGNCVAQGFDSGDIGCNQACMLDTSGCCSDYAYYQCQGGDVYWLDSCGQLGPKKEECGIGNCFNTGNQTAECEACECNSGLCCNGCNYRPSNYVCENNAQIEYGCPWGQAPGDDVGSRTRARLCSGSSSACDGSYGPWSGWSTVDFCSNDEVCQPGDPTCNPAPCPDANYWSPALDTDIDNTGLQSNQSINVSIQMEVRETGSQLEFRVCKLGSNFQENVKVAIYDAATNSQVGALAENLATAGQQCSLWTDMINDGNYAESEVFGGVWNVVSPASSAGDWQTWGGCSVNGNPTGTCWSGINITLTRTCKGF